jgi:hypothetical protein
MKLHRFKIKSITGDDRMRDISLLCEDGGEYAFRVDNATGQILLPGEQKWRALDFYLEVFEFVRDCVGGMAAK